jgi:hypothetical protein
VLIYCINKKSGYKVASFYSLDKNEPEFSYWNAKDSRIDSTESDLTNDLILFIREYVKTKGVKTNHLMLDDDTKKKENSPTTKSTARTRTSDRIASAVRRAQLEQEVGIDEPTAMEESVMEQPELPFYDQRSDETEVESQEPRDLGSENPIDRMRWSSR